MLKSEKRGILWDCMIEIIYNKKRMKTFMNIHKEARVRWLCLSKQTYQLFAASLLAASAGAYIGVGMAKAISSWYWGLVILEFCLFIWTLCRQKKTRN
jgi:FtsH-binding integral membrane protein